MSISSRWIKCRRRSSGPSNFSSLISTEGRPGGSPLMTLRSTSLSCRLEPHGHAHLVHGGLRNGARAAVAVGNHVPHPVGIARQLGAALANRRQVRGQLLTQMFLVGDAAEEAGPAAGRDVLGFRRVEL